MTNETNQQLFAELTTILDWVRFCASELVRGDTYLGHGTDNPWDEAVQLVMHNLSLPVDLPKDYMHAKLTGTEKNAIYQMMQQRIQEKIPLPYLTNTAYWAGLEFYVNENVLIPRSPIFEQINDGFSAFIDDEPRRILDLCTGSGCIAIALAQGFPDSEIYASDISEEALEVAQTNLDIYELNDQIELLLSDGLKGLNGLEFDLIVSNPPYVDADDMATMPDEFNHEPELALASGDDGLDFTRELLAQAKDFLSPDGVLIVEVGNSRWALEQAFPDLPFTWIEFERGGHGVFVLRRSDLD